jgi:hypothetical protein
MIFMIKQLPQTSIDWETFFPTTEKTSLEASWLKHGTQYIITSLSEMDAEKLQKSGIIERFYSLEPYGFPATLLLFSKKKQNVLLQALRHVPKAGTAMAAEAIFDNARKAFYNFAIYIAPLLVAMGFLLFPTPYWATLLLELTLFVFLNVVVISVLGVPLNLASMLAGFFLVVYAMTLLNYLHLGDISSKKLALGIGVSLSTTLLSALFLSLSEFGLIREFGHHLLAGLSLLTLFLVLRLYGLRHETLSLPWIQKGLAVLPQRWFPPLLLIFFFSGSLFILMHPGALRVEINPLSLLPRNDALSMQIHRFERNHIPSLPVILIYEKEADISLENLESIRKIDEILGRMEQIGKLKPLVTPGKLFRIFAQRDLSEADETMWAQFLLALEFEDGITLFSPDGKRLFATYLIPLDTPSSKLETLKKMVESLDSKIPGTLTLGGKAADFERMGTLFKSEGITGFAVSFFFILLFFLFYCGTWRIVPVIFVSAALPPILFLVWHMAFDIPLSIVSLISLILYAGLYADSFIHLFVCYARERNACISKVLRPVVVSNLTMITALAGIALTGSIPGKFGEEMAILLLFHLLTTVSLLPWLLNHFVRQCRVHSELPSKIPTSGTSGEDFS